MSLNYSVELLPDYIDEPETCAHCDETKDLSWNEYDDLVCPYCREQGTFKEFPIHEIEELEVVNG